MSVLKKLSVGLSSSGGRNNRGRITSYHRGGGHKRRYRYIDFNRKLLDIGGVVVSLEKDPNRSAFIGLVCYSNGLMTYIVAPEGLCVGDKIVTSSTGVIDESLYNRVGSMLQIKHGKVGEMLCNVELIPGKGSQLARSAGTYVQFVKNYVEDNTVLVKLRSGEFRVIPGDCFAMIGVISNIGHSDVVIGKAGKSRWLGRRPIVRGVAMNPVDHPHGGGEGKKSGSGKTPWGRITRGRKTRAKSKVSPFIIKKSVVRS